MAEEDEWDELPDLSFMGDPEELKAKAEAELRATPNAESPPSRVDGVDKSGSVQITVDLDGQVQDVEVLDDWNEHLSSDELPKSLFQAYVIALRNAMNAKALAALAREKTRPPEEPKERSTPALDPDIPEVGDENFTAAIGAVMDEIETSIQRIELIEAGGGDGERTVSSPSGCVTVLLRGAEVVGVRGNPGRIENTGHELLRQEVLTAFRRAQR